MLLNSSEHHQDSPSSYGPMLSKSNLAVSLRSARYQSHVAIMNARICYGNWRQGYLLLDNMLHLWPNKIHEKTLRTILQYRPVHEVYQIFYMSCIAGIQIHPTTFMMLFNCLSRCIFISQQSSARTIFPSLTWNLDLLGAMFQAL